MGQQLITEVGAFWTPIKDKINANFTELYAGSGSASIVHSATKILTNAQIKGLPNAPIELIPAPGVNLIVTILGGGYFVNAAGGHYSGMDATGELGLGYGGFIVAGWCPNTGGFNVLTKMLSNNYVYEGLIPGGVSPDITSNLAATAGSTDTIFPTSPINTAISILVNQPDTGLDFGGGNAANTMVVSALYTLFNVLTGELS